MNAPITHELFRNYFCNCAHTHLCNPPGLFLESLGPFGPEVSRECPSGCLRGPLGPGLRSVQKVFRECPPGVSKRCPDTPGPKGPKNTPRDTPGTLRARRARETPVAGRGDRKHICYTKELFPNDLCNHFGPHSKVCSCIFSIGTISFLCAAPLAQSSGPHMSMHVHSCYLMQLLFWSLSDLILR